MLFLNGLIHMHGLDVLIQVICRFNPSYDVLRVMTVPKDLKIWNEAAKSII